MSNEKRKQQSNEALMAWLLKQENGEEAWVGNVWSAAVEWADSHPQWIPVEERLPERMNEKSRFSETVLVYNKDGYKDTAYYDFEEKIWRWMPMVTHWMPIVPPRKEAKNEQD